MTDDDMIDSMSDAWAGLHGLRRNANHSGHATLQPLFTATTEELVRTASAEHHGEELLDQSRVFRVPGTLRDSVLVSAPVEATLLRLIGNPGRIVDEVWAIADALALRVRVGNPRDSIYRGHDAVLPIVWWDPERISLPYPPLR